MLQGTLLQCRYSESGGAPTLGLEHACHREVGPLDTDLDACHAEVLRQDTISNIMRHRLEEIVMRTLHDKLNVPAEDPPAVLCQCSGPALSGSLCPCGQPIRTLSKACMTSLRRAGFAAAAGDYLGEQLQTGQKCMPVDGRPVRLVFGIIVSACCHKVAIQ